MQMINDPTKLKNKAEIMVFRGLILVGDMLYQDRIDVLSKLKQAMLGRLVTFLLLNGSGQSYQRAIGPLSRHGVQRT